jgi:hypothetical protein
MGETAVQVRAVYADGGAVRSAPLPLRIREPALLPAIAGAPPEGEGLLALVDDGQGGVRRLTVDKLHGRLKDLEPDGPQPVTIQLHGYLKIEQPGLYQLAVRSQGRVRLSLHDQALLDERLSTQEAEAFVALGLESGWHPLQIELEPGAGKPLLQIVLAGQTPPVMLSEQQLGHRAQVPAD